MNVDFLVSVCINMDDGANKALKHIEMYIMFETEDLVCDKQYALS